MNIAQQEREEAIANYMRPLNVDFLAPSRSPENAGLHVRYWIRSAASFGHAGWHGSGAEIPLHPLKWHPTLSSLNLETMFSPLFFLPSSVPDFCRVGHVRPQTWKVQPRWQKKIDVDSIRFHLGREDSSQLRNKSSIPHKNGRKMQPWNRKFFFEVSAPSLLVACLSFKLSCKVT